MQEEFSPEVADTLVSFGWSPDRRVDPSSWTAPFEEQGMVVHEVVRDFLARFGGLRFDISGTGITAARTPFEIDPLLCIGEEDRFTEWGAELGVEMFPLGELENGHLFLAMDQHGVVYLVMDWVARYGPWPEAIDSLVRGVKPETIVD
ncbi:SUKH-3 immunity protein [Streptomyces sp. 2224.1]|nr:SUKH-3 immunity protein of toxin-antitoxin system [Streptomyces sp. 2321.6]SDR42171.1 SUKH-3 immunity protein [Streptomyces sp. KS_16]SEC06246.1 SUKH-3 immunity protein [Streptomyces sp. 2224.1]SEC97325.1 SUKH-3 immunity protein [Streptomyces sp. 2133.1]SEE77726.1 SUKH-3 immunity protein [Streptomyces sp. 2112.3]SNC69536.1 SUKH-3 immunity protein [Streptomyces sp. 2114.4]